MPAARSLSLMVAVALTGCVHVPMHIAHLPLEQLQRTDEFDLCAAWSTTEAARLRTEIDRRGLVSAEDWKMVQEHKVATGMSTCAVLASLGYPADTVDLSSPEGPTIRLIYFNDLFARTYMIDIRDHVVVTVGH